MNGTVKLLVLDVLKPHEPDVVLYADHLCRLDGIEVVNIAVVEFDARTESIKLTIKGNDVKLEEVSNTIRTLGGSVHSLDRVLTARVPIGENIPIGGED